MAECDLVTITWPIVGLWVGLGFAFAATIAAISWGMRRE